MLDWHPIRHLGLLSKVYPTARVINLSNRLLENKKKAPTGESDPVESLLQIDASAIEALSGNVLQSCLFSNPARTDFSRSATNMPQS